MVFPHVSASLVTLAFLERPPETPAPLDRRLGALEPGGHVAGRDACNAAMAPSRATFRNFMIVERSTPARVAAWLVVSSPVRISTRSRTSALPTEPLRRAQRRR
jgi:hypothetical protein